MQWGLFAIQVWGVVLVTAATVMRVHLAAFIMAVVLLIVSVLRVWAEPGRTTRWFVWISPVVLAVAVIVWLAAG
ncbi:MULTISPECIES: hypothetical protein [unclassified Microbacterium]|uniref:hypothetical protein n=1 Tax=unclassified Microbacterium TaxID=2609290 RepID=UPI00301A39B2